MKDLDWAMYTYCPRGLGDLEEHKKKSLTHRRVLGAWRCIDEMTLDRAQKATAQRCEFLESATRMSRWMR